MAEHRQEFRRELDGIEAKVIELFAMVAEDVPTATQALLTGNNEALPLLAERDRVIEMDDLHASLVAELASGRMTLPVTMEMALVARLYKRLGARYGCCQAVSVGFRAASVDPFGGRRDRHPFRVA